MRPYLIIALALLALAVSASAQTVMVQSGRYVDFRQLLSREAPTDQVITSMTVRLPDEARDRYPAVVIVHTIAGYQEANEGWHAEQFRKAGFATLTYSSEAAQRLREGGGDSVARSAWPSAVAEAYAAFRLLADHPRIELLRYKGLICWRHWPVEPWLHTAKAKARVEQSWRGCEALNAWLAKKRPGWRIEVKARPEGSTGFTPVRKRWVVERTNAWNGRARRHSKDYERKPESAAAMIQLSNLHLMLRKLAPSTQREFRYAAAA